MRGYRVILEDIDEINHVVILSYRMQNRKERYDVGIAFENEGAAICFEGEGEESLVEYQYTDFDSYAALQEKMVEDILRFFQK